ncbi:MAG TPA: hypothetical protein VMV81_06380 [Phycisphaerae bacterium]|nr:hypothetical protein [Phycisphaerae bacterium]
MSDNPTAESLRHLLGREIVLDTEGPIIYIGVLEEVREDGFWLARADLRDRSEGVVTKERYICEAREMGIRPNRARIFVFARVVISVSALDDVVMEYAS